MESFVQLLFAAIAGGLLAGVFSKVLEIFYGEVLRNVERRSSARRFVNENLDPVLKSADDLFGKLRFLASTDFRAIQDSGKGGKRNLDLIELLYFLAKFWASIEVFRKKGLSVSIAEDDRGEKLSQFLDSLESRKIRLVDRLTQRVIAELLLETSGHHIASVSFIGFLRELNSSEEAREWTRRLALSLEATGHTRERQRVLAYGVLVHAMIDTLDVGHRVSHDRSPYPGKLSKKTWRDLKYRVFGRYLTFVSNPDKYLGPPKRQP